MKTILVDAIHTFVSTEGEMNQEMYTLLEQYPNRKIVLTMAPDEKMEEWNLNTLPYEVYTSKLNPRKSDPAFYTQVLDAFDLSADSVVCFEHDPEAVQSAESVGIVSYFYDSNKKDLESLKTFLDTNL